ncbi:uncharacterized protein LOC119466618 isoform X2 [Dermacentor silvarum]|uniref:uncharacterized protein LOC119466618 isoform X2 n=1 Tax=Dermacentor silvarum TaxID=543639 RepID=UPI002101CD98|nr:uncharacterized protein LOC119466618 isoform X2 [Dermacentor silvarum]
MEHPTIVGNAAGAADDTFQAIVTHVAPEHRWLKLFVQRNHEMMRHIEAYLEGLEPALSSKPGFMHQSQIALGTPCFARYSDNKWYRAVVSSWPRHNETLVEVTFIDYGNREEVCVDDVRQSPDPIFRTPQGVYECFLDELDLSHLTPEGAENLVLLSKSKLLSVEVTVTVHRYEQVQVNCIRPVVSVTMPDGKSLADVLARSAAFTNATVPAVPTPIFTTPNIELGVPYRVYVSHVETMCDVFLHLATRDPMAFTEMIQETYADAVPLDPALVRKETACLARFTEDSLLYRSLVVDCFQGSCRVVFVDYGNYEVKSTSDLLVIPPDLLQEPTFALRCNASSTGLDKDTFLEVTAEQELTCTFSRDVISSVYTVEFEGLNGNKAPPAVVCGPCSGLSGNLLPVTALHTQIQRLRLDPGCSHVMYITFIESTEVLYAQLKEMADEIDQISAQLEAESPSLAMLSPADIMPGLAVACRYEGTWYRAEVIEPGPQVQVWIADYGDTVTLDISELRQLDLKYTLQPAYAMKLALDGFKCPPHASKEIAPLLEKLVLDTEASVSIVDVLPDGTHSVKIFVGDPPKSVVRLLNMPLGLVSASVPSPWARTVEKLLVTNVAPPRNFFGQFMSLPEGDLDNLQKELEDCYSASSPNPAFRPRSGEHICCRFSEDGQFYRAEVREVSTDGSQYDVFYLDYGNEETVSSQDVRPLKPQFAIAPPFGIPCELKFGQVSDDMIDTEVEVRWMSTRGGGVHIVEFTSSGQSLPSKAPPAVVAPAQGSAPANMNTFGGGEAPAQGLAQLQLGTGVQEQATVVVVKSLSEFYGQLTRNDDQLNNVDTVLASVASAQPGLPPAMRKVGTACCALYSEDGCWYRGVIRELHPGSVTVFFVDYGNSENVDDSGIKQLPDSLRSIPCQAVACRLSGAVAMDAAAATARLDEILVDQEVTLKVHRCSPDKVHDVDIILPTGVNARDQLIQEGLVQCSGGLACPPQPPASSVHMPPVQMSSQELYHVGGFQYPALIEGVAVPVEVCWVLTPGEVFVQLAETRNALEQLMSEMQTYYATLGDVISSDIRPGQACVALYSEDGQWYRARVVHAKGGLLGVQYVDYGNCEEIPEGSVRQILAKYAVLPAQAVRCRIRSVAPPGGRSTWPVLVDQGPLEQAFEGAFLCRPAAQKDGVHLVDLERQGGGPSLVETLVAAGLAADVTTIPRELGSTSEASQSQKQALRAVISPAEFVFHPKQYVDIKVTAVVSMSEVWCCLVECVEPMAKALQEAGDAAPKFRNPVPGEACVARLPAKDEGAEGDAVLTPWARAVVKSRPSPAKLELFFVDVGGTRVVHHTEVKQIPPELTTQPGYAFQCVLSCSFPADTSELSAKILYKELVLQVEQQLEPAKVIGSLFDTSGDNEVNILDTFAHPLPEGAPAREESPIPEEIPTPAEQVQESQPVLEDGAVAAGTATVTAGTATVTAGTATVAADTAAVAADTAAVAADTAAVAADTAAVVADIATVAADTAAAVDDTAAAVDDTAAAVDDTAAAVDDTVTPAVKSVAPKPEVTRLPPERSSAPARTSSPTRASRPPFYRGPSSYTIVPCYPPLSKISGKMAVYVMHAEDLSCFYIMRKEQEHALENLATRLETYYVETPEPIVKPLPKLPCVVFYPQDEAWYRAKVAVDGSCVHFVDYGNSDIVPEVRAIAAEFLEVPPFCYKCKLDGAKDLAGVPGVVSAFKEMIADAELELEVMTWGPEVTVRLSKGGQDITTALKSRFLCSEPAALTVGAPEEPAVSLVDTLATEPSPADAKGRALCTVSHVDSLSSFFMLFSTKLDVLTNLVDKLQEVLASNAPTVVETPDSSTLYAALYSEDNLWYRARVEGPAEKGGFKVRFVDYGNAETVESVVSLDSEELRVEPFSIECRLADVGDTGDVDAVEKFRELVLDSDLLVETVKPGKPMTVRLFTLDGVDLHSKLPLQKTYRALKVPLHQKAHVHIIHVESATNFFVHFNDRLDALESLTKQLLEVPVNENAPADMSLPCMVYWTDDLPYRITVIEGKNESEPGGTAQSLVKFVDYGNTDTVERAGIRQLPDALLAEPLFAINCTLDVPEGKLGQEATEKLQLLADAGPASSLLAEFLGERNGCYVVRLLDMGMDVLEKLQGAARDASEGGSGDVTGDDSVFEGPTETPEDVPEAPATEGADKPDDGAPTELLAEHVPEGGSSDIANLTVVATSCSMAEQALEETQVSEEAAILVHQGEPTQCLEAETSQDTLEDKEALELAVGAESLEREGPLNEVPDVVALKDTQSSEACEDLPKEDALPEPKCTGSSVLVDSYGNVSDEAKLDGENLAVHGGATSSSVPEDSAVDRSATLQEEVVLPQEATVSAANSAAVIDGSMLPEIPEFGNEDLSILAEDNTLTEDTCEAAVFEGTVSEDKADTEAAKEGAGALHTTAADIDQSADVQIGASVQPENEITDYTTAEKSAGLGIVNLADEQSALAGSGEAYVAKTLSEEAQQEKPKRESDACDGSAVSEVGLTPKGNDALSSPQQAGVDDSSAIGAAATVPTTISNIGAGGDGTPAVVPNGSMAQSSPITPRCFRKRLSLDDCPIPGACTNAELLEIPSENVN